MTRIAIPILFALILLSSGCYNLVYKRRDMQNVRRQLHLPAAAEFLSFNSSPKEAGFFGREGLRITAVVQLSTELFEEYVAHLDDTTVWKPVRFFSYSPSIADEYSPEALRWNRLPIPDTIKERFRCRGFTPEGTDILKGSYYCSVIQTVRGQPMESNPAAYHWNYTGRSCSELIESDHPTILTFAVLDYENKSIFVHLQFSG